MQHRAVGQQHQRQLLAGGVEQRVQALRLGIPFELEPLVVHVVPSEEHPSVVAVFRPAVADDPNPVEAEAVRALPIGEEVVEDREESLLGWRPRFHQVVVEPDVVDRLDRHVGVGVGGEQHELGAGCDRRGMPEELDAGHLGHAVIGDDEGDGLVPAGELFSVLSASAPDVVRTSRYRSP